MALVPRAVLVTRPTAYAALLARHGTPGQARFFLESRGQKLEPIQGWHARFLAARRHILSVIPATWRRTAVARDDLDRFLFEPEDVVIALGQDGLVANVAKYLSGQPVLGVNPDPERQAGVLVPLSTEAAGRLLEPAAAGAAEVERRTMVEARLDDGQVLRALNEVYLGHRSHQSSRYRISFQGADERHSSSGVIVSTGTGATGWALSVRRQRACDLTLPRPADDQAAFFVREAWPSVWTQATLTEGAISGGQTLSLTSEMNEGGVIFGDGIEDDRLDFGWGCVATVGPSSTRLNLVRG